MTDTEDVAVVPADDAQQAQKAEPEQKTELAHPDGADASDQSTEAEGEQLTDEQRTIRKLERRIARLTAKNGGTARERDLLREHIQQIRAGGADDSEQEPQATPQDIEQRAVQRAREMVHYQSLNEKADKALKSGAKLSGFTDAVAVLREEVSFADRSGRITPFLEAVLDADDPARVIHYLGQNPDEAAEFADLSPAQLGRRLEKLETRLAQDGKAKSKAPAPIEPIGGARAKTGDLQSMSMDDYVAHRRKQKAAWAR